MKRLFIVKLMVVLALQPVGLTFAGPDTMSGQFSISEPDASVMSCTLEKPVTCPDMSHCATVGHLNCDAENTSLIIIHDLQEAHRPSRLDSTHEFRHFQVISEVILRPPRTS